MVKDGSDSHGEQTPRKGASESNGDTKSTLIDYLFFMVFFAIVAIGFLLFALMTQSFDHKTLFVLGICLLMGAASGRRAYLAALLRRAKIRNFEMKGLYPGDSWPQRNDSRYVYGNQVPVKGELGPPPRNIPNDAWR